MHNIAILGLGVVGNGVFEVINGESGKITSTLGGINIKHVLDRRDFTGHPLADRVTSDYEKILADKSVSVVVETMGGASPAFEFSKAALEAGKSVVTSNKLVVDKYGDILLDTAAKNNVSYLYEASAGGGIPVIASLEGCLYSNKITEISGILNGTTNFILTKMETEGMAFEDALTLAQSLGYAEANPASDVSGDDSARKICILAGIAFGRYITFDKIADIRGITEIKPGDFPLASKLGYTIKLIATAKLENDGASISVSPRLVRKGSIFSSVSGAFNAVRIKGTNIGTLFFYGLGAGSLPTASAVVTDIIEVIKNRPRAVCRIPAEDGFIKTHTKGEEVMLGNGSVYEVFE